MKTIGIIQARMSSTRLPGKILMSVLGKPLLGYQMDRLAQVKNVDQWVVATSTDASDDVTASFCRDLGFECFRGPMNDVLARYHSCALKYHAEAVVRVTSDCPLIDPDIVTSVVTAFLDAKESCDYVSNVRDRTYPRGFDTEVFSMKALSRAFDDALTPAEREHVTLYIYSHPELFRLKGIRSKTDLSRHRWTVDTNEDFELISKIIEHLYPMKPHFRLQDILALLDANPEWSFINNHVEQKKI